MARVVALYRYPIKSFTPETCESLTVLPTGRIAGDRTLAIRFADAPVSDDEWCRKYHGVVLANTPGLARLTTTFDHERLRLRVALDHTQLVDEALDDHGRKRIVEALTDYVVALDENPLKGHPERLPLKLIGDGRTARYQDNAAGQITLHSRESLASVAAALHDANLNELRFRSNIVLEGLSPWEEQSWLNQVVRIGSVELEVVKPETRCLATHANPATGERDLQVMQTLVKAFAQQQPTFAVAMLTRGAGGEIRLGDEVHVRTSAAV